VNEIGFTIFIEDLEDKKNKVVRNIGLFRVVQVIDSRLAIY
jgi:hypothetical protein